MIPRTLLYGCVPAQLLVTTGVPRSDVLPPPPSGSVQIHRDEWGVPHIVADRVPDGFYGLGYAQAEDQLETILAFILAARFLGLENEIGTLEAGKLADLVVLNANPLDDIRQTTDIRYVMIDGNLYDRSTLDQVWPLERAYGPHPWTDDDITRRDVRGDEFWNRR